MDRSELARFLFTAERYDHTHAALAVLLGLNGPRVSEACSTDIADLAFEHGHRTRHATPTGTVFGERPLRFNSTIQSSKRSSTVARNPVWRPLPTSVSSSARAFFASRRLPWHVRADLSALAGDDIATGLDDELPHPRCSLPHPGGGSQPRHAETVAHVWEEFRKCVLDLQFLSLAKRPGKPYSTSSMVVGRVGIEPTTRGL